MPDVTNWFRELRSHPAVVRTARTVDDVVFPGSGRYLQWRLRRSNFLGGGADEPSTIAGTTIAGDTCCKSTNVESRVDTPTARSFLANYVALP